MGMNSGVRRKNKIAVMKRKNREKKALREKKILKVPYIFLDESGNTGANLVDKDQPFFTMASVCFDDGEAEKLISLINSNSPGEVHFSKLKRRKVGQDAMLKMLQSKLINKESVKVCVYHKEYMIVTKIVDILIEYLAHATDFDLYENEYNIFLSKKLYYCLPLFCGEENSDNTYKLFVKMVRERTEESIGDFYTSVEVLSESLTNEGLRRDIDLLLATRRIVHDALRTVDKSMLDPLIPSLFIQLVKWGEDYPKGFHVIHDDSKELKLQKDVFEKFMDWTKKSIEIGNDRRAFGLPLKAMSLDFSDSEKYAQLQVADVVASAVNYWASGVSRGEKEDYFFLELDKLSFRDLICGVIWPDKETTLPGEVGSIEGRGNLVDGMVKFIESRI